MLDTELEREFLGLLDRPVQDRHPSRALDQAIGIRGWRYALVPASAPAVESSVLDDAGIVLRPTIGGALRLCQILLRVRRRLGRQPIRGVIAELSSRAVWQPATEPVSLDSSVRSFLAARRKLPFAPHCLTDSLALLEWLGPARREAMLVLGVKLDPFAAHCWVQHGPRLLNDRPDVVELFHIVRTITCSPASP